MSKLVGLDKQLENLAIKWYVKNNYDEQLRNASKADRSALIENIKRNINKKDVIKQYLEANPRMKKQYEMKKRRINKIKIASGVGIVVLGTVTGTLIHNNSNKQSTQNNQQEVEYDYKEAENEFEQLSEDKDYSEFFEEIGEMNNTEKRDERIVEFTKQKIVEAYNKENSQKPINVEQLEYLHLDENVLVNKDKFGNDVSYERVSQRERIDVKENQELKKMPGGINVYMIDGEPVAVYNFDGQEVKDNSIEDKEEFFKKTLNMVDKMIKLQDIYKYRSNETEIKKAEDNYRAEAEKLANIKDIKETEKEYTIE